MTKNLVISPTNGQLANYSDLLAELGQRANEAANSHIFNEDWIALSENTQNTYVFLLNCFSKFLMELGVDLPVEVMISKPDVWTNVTYGLVRGFQNWMLQNEYAIRTANQALSAVRKYCHLAWQAGYMDEREYLLIKSVQGRVGKQARNIDNSRLKVGKNTRRVGSKKAKNTVLNVYQAAVLKYKHSDTPQGRRDKLLMTILLDHGIRASEVSALKIEDIEMESRIINIYRQKTDTTDRHTMTPDSYEAFKSYLEQDAFESGCLLRNSHKGGRLTTAGMTPQKVTDRVKRLGKVLLDIDTLSAHDCRHYYATSANAAGSSRNTIQQAGGWKTSVMVDYYIDALEITNDGLKLMDTSVFKQKILQEDSVENTPSTPKKF